MNHLEQLVAEWLEYKGYFVRQSVRVGARAQGGFEGELDVVAIHPEKQHLIHVECSLDTNSWAKRQQSYALKFERGRKYIPTLFKGFSLPGRIDQVAVLMFIGKTRPPDLGGARLVSTDDFMSEVAAELRQRPLNSGIIPDTFPLLRSVHVALRSKSEAPGSTLVASDKPS
jgi:Holliday junction resolvase-like predicted endonuclease